MLIGFGSLLCLAICAFPAASPPPHVPISEDEIESLVQQLADRDYSQRNNAFLQLEQLGEAAKVQLEKALKSKNLEIRRSADRLLLNLKYAKSIEQRREVERRISALLNKGVPLPGWNRYNQLVVPNEQTV